MPLIELPSLWGVSKRSPEYQSVGTSDDDEEENDGMIKDTTEVSFPSTTENSKTSMTRRWTLGLALVLLLGLLVFLQDHGFWNNDGNKNNQPPSVPHDSKKDHGTRSPVQEITSPTQPVELETTPSATEEATTKATTTSVVTTTNAVSSTSTSAATTSSSTTPATTEMSSSAATTANNDEKTTATVEATTSTKATEPVTTTSTPLVATTTLATTSTPATTTTTTGEPVLSLEERYQYVRDAEDNNITWYREPKDTPTGWWPDDLWVRSCVEEPRNLTPFATLPEWEDYRLGDCIKVCRGCPTPDHHPELADWTIAGEYYDLACPPHGFMHQPKGNETLLDMLVDEREGQEGFTKPDPRAVVIHLRLGDKVENAKAGVYEILQDGAEPFGKGTAFNGYKALKSVYEFMTDIWQSQAPQVVIRGGSQLPLMYRKSKTYAYCIKAAAEKAGYEVEMNLEEGNADFDFFYLSHARKVIVTLGGYSRFIGHAVIRRGGMVIGRMFEVRDKSRKV